MSDRQIHRASLLLALAGAILLIVTLIGRMQPGSGLPNRDSSGRPANDRPRPFQGSLV